jgi:hypothetical protein
MAGRLGLEEQVRRYQQTVDAMLVFSTAYVLQSACGRVAIVCYRGTEAGTFGNWLGDADVGSERMTLGEASLEASLAVAGFRRNMRATRWGVLEQLRLVSGQVPARSRAALSARRSGPSTSPATASAAPWRCCSRCRSRTPEQRELLERLRAVCTLRAAARRLRAASAHRRDPRANSTVTSWRAIPSALPPALRRPHPLRQGVSLGGRRVATAETAIAQLSNWREIPRSLLAFFARAERRDRLVYAMAEHAPHHYLAALRPPERVTELGDRL